MPKKHPEHVNLERWLVSYADFITLLFAFFVILYASSKTDSAKFKKVAESLAAAFGDTVDRSGKSGGKTVEQFDPNIAIGGQVIDMPIGRVNVMTPATDDLKKLADVLEESVSFELGASDMAEKIQLTYEDRGLVVKLSAKDFFDAGSAEVKQDAMPVLDQMLKALSTTKRFIRVEGHTDSGKLVSEQFPSNWELSAGRAAWIVRYMIKKYGFNPKLLEVSGMAEFRPVSPNDTETGRAKNRRVEIIVLSKPPL